MGTIYVLQCRNTETWHENKGNVFGTYYEVKYLSAEDFHTGLQQELARLDSTFSLFNQESLLTRLNSNRTDSTNAMFRDVFVLAQRVNRLTYGALDITIAPLVKAWGFGPNGIGKTPTETQLDSLRAFVGMDKVSLQHEHLQKTDARVALDLGAIAKGYAVDRLAAYLAAQGITNYMVEIGGEVVAHGVNDQGKPWTVGIIEPTTEGARLGTIHRVVTLGTGAMATSGNYLNFYQQGAKKVAHTIDPRTAMPIQRNIISATVLAEDCATADAFATAFMVLGLDSAQRVLNDNPALRAYLIYLDADGTHKVFEK
ncbi:MAG: FAD:protein FMN transferase [Bacteroidaceae bacterium]|nr:FAD:protein FMN transferase [Bacteroidaceae bacterium]